MNPGFANHLGIAMAFNALGDHLRTERLEQDANLSQKIGAKIKLALISAGGKAPLDHLYAQIEKSAPERLATNQHWREKVRQTLNRNTGIFKPIERGVWAVA